MKITLIILALVSSSLTAYAKSTQQTSCHDQAVIAAVKHNFKSFGAGTSSCGIKPVQISEQLETYAVCTSDETEPMEYLVVVEKNVWTQNKPVKKCVVQYIGNTYDSQTPSFEDETDLIQNAIGCSIDSGDKKLVCNK